MATQDIVIVLEFPINIDRREISDLEKAIKDVQGVETDIQATRNPLAVITLIVEIAASVGAVAGNIKSTYEVAEIVHRFLHHEDKGKADEQRPKKFIFRQGDKQVELDNYSVEEIKQLFSPKN